MIPMFKDKKRMQEETGENYFETNDRLKKLIDMLEVNTLNDESLIASMPFSQNDITAGSENELQAAVMGKSSHVDLPTMIRNSSYYKNIIRRAAAGDTSALLVESLEEILNDANKNIWENSWVRFPARHLSLYAKRVFEYDLLRDKTELKGPNRSDCDCFKFHKNNEMWLRTPISYLLKLSLADVISSVQAPPRVRILGKQFMMHFLNDNTSPETFSFYPVSLSKDKGMGKEIANETLKRFFLSQLLTMYANKRFKLAESGQEALVYFAPHPPIRQKQLNQLIPDTFYRELFMSPCLSGWNRGENKHRYMKLCHQVLSRSQLNATSKLKEAGIINRNLIVLPNISNISLANNGTHVSLGSKKLTDNLKNGFSGFNPKDEKFYGDLAIKIIEHFLPLFVGTYSAAPYRIDFWDFHPEKVLGFLPHELDFTHLRMMWRRWKKKAKLKCFGQPLTPFGPELMDRYISKIFRLKGDFVHDFRLIDYLAALLSTDQSPALNGSLNNEKKLLKDLDSLGVFDSSMSLYLLYRLRREDQIGFSGFEGRYYSLFHHLGHDMGNAVNLQLLISSYAYKLILKGEVTHRHIPDDMFIESERRQIFFGTAIGIPTFYVKQNTKNIFIQKILQCTDRTRFSSRYPGYIRVYNKEYRKALFRILKKEAGDLIEMFQLAPCMEDLSNRMNHPETHAVSSKLTTGIMEEAGAKRPNNLTGDAFNTAAENYYRNTLRNQHIQEGFQSIEKGCSRILDANDQKQMHFFKSLLASIMHSGQRAVLLKKMMNNQLSEKEICKLIYITLIVIGNDMELSQTFNKKTVQYDLIHTTSIH